MVNLPLKQVRCFNWIEGKPHVESTLETFNVTSPYTGELLGNVDRCSPKTLEKAIQTADKASQLWRKVPLKERCALMFRFREELVKRSKEIANMAALECGKLPAEAEAGLMKGVEVLEYALSLQNIDQGGRMHVSRGVQCEFRREPLGVVAGITPFNFPAMVPMWMIPIAITLGNSFIWKPSDKTPLTSTLIAECFYAAGFPAGVLTIVHGGRDVVESICDNPKVKAVGFVGSSAVAKSVYQRTSNAGNRALALGGAKNHLILMPDADASVAAPGILGSFTGCAGQRCMAASVVCAVGNVDHVIQQVVTLSQKMVLGQDMGAIISKESLEKLNVAIAAAEKAGAKILIDGRKAVAPKGFEKGFWLGPTILDNVKPGTQAACEELFGPVVSIVRCASLSEAVEISNASPYGNATSVFTTSGAVAEEVATRANSGMIGVNIGVPVPREPFSFGGTKESKYGVGDITGEAALNFWSDLKKVTLKWELQKDQNWMS